MRNRFINLSSLEDVQIRIYQNTLLVEFIDFLDKLIALSIKREESFESVMENFFVINLPDNEHLTNEQWDEFTKLLFNSCSEFKVIHNYRKNS